MRRRSEALSAYRFMWLLVMFDLPVVTKAQRKKATAFRKWLLDEGYEMSQFSVYMRFCAGKEQVERRIRDIGRNLPGTGSIHALWPLSGARWDGFGRPRRRSTGPNDDQRPARTTRETSPATGCLLSTLRGRS